MSELIDDVREDIRRAQLISLWKRYGHWLIAAIIAIVVLTFAFNYWQNYRHEQNIIKALDYEQALTLWNNDQTQAVSVLQKIAKNKDEKYAVISLFKQAGHSDNRVQALESIANNTKFDTPLRELATYMLALNQLDTANPEVLAQQLKPIADNNSLWRSLANEALGFTLFRIGKTQNAKEIFSILAQDRSSPEGVRLRASALTDYIKHH